MQRKALIGMILVLVALIMVGISFVMPWYSFSAEISSTGVSSEISADYYLDHAEMEALGETESMDYEDMEDSETLDVFNTTRIMVILGIVGCIIGLIGAAMVMMEKMGNKLGAVLVLIALILALLAPIYIMFALPAAFKNEMGDVEEVEGLSSGMGDSFFGSESSSTDLGGGISMSTEFSWGGGTGWFMALIGFILLIVALIMVLKAETAPAAQSQPEPQPAYQQPTQPPSPPPRVPPPPQ